MVKRLVWVALVCVLIAACAAKKRKPAQMSTSVTLDDDLPACAAGRAKTFLMGFTGHTGSTAIISMMRQHSELRVPDLEPLTRRADKVDYTIRTFGNPDFTEKVVGFKIRPADIDEAEADFGRIVKDHQTRLITLVRKNFFKAAMGLYTVRALMDNSAMMGLSPEKAASHCKERPEICRFEIRNMKFFAFLLHRYAQGGESVEHIRNRLPFTCELKVTYEEFLVNRDEVMAKIYKFLGVKNEVLAPAFAKVVADNPCEVISNYQEVCTKLWGCEQMREYLEDPQHGCFCEDKTAERREELCNYDVLLRQENLICYDHLEREVPCNT
eukprot:Plantae.Rhodophyta-Purpureofilum_apyrenoidigerum.ctg1202.p1 GENE.Plantae.Rhodophyta-Purpureofilum_apyrenoidigerum.ctg1202~~Plantae.Rhodophyta-Purpureofilum_apyrenoidigerum.ctg1202.p1  ORF type:complete len:326 (-),score=69.31 Plantae.Rhodophyta-Purpureofilum_apyrenoidigerum.ctg1202:366-1343(-)